MGSDHKSIDGTATLWAVATFSLPFGLDMLGYQNPYLGTLLVAISLICFWYAIRLSVPFPRWLQSKMPLPEAARRAYEKLDGTLWREAADKFEKSSEGRLKYMAIGIAHEIPIFGKRPPSTKYGEIDKSLFSPNNIQDGANTISAHFLSQGIEFVDLAINKSDLRIAIRRMCSAR